MDSTWRNAYITFGNYKKRSYHHVTSKHSIVRKIDQRDKIKHSRAHAGSQQIIRNIEDGKDGLKEFIPPTYSQNNLALQQGLHKKSLASIAFRKHVRAHVYHSSKYLFNIVVDNNNLLRSIQTAVSYKYMVPSEMLLIMHNGKLIDKSNQPMIYNDDNLHITVKGVGGMYSDEYQERYNMLSRDHKRTHESRPGESRHTVISENSSLLQIQQRISRIRLSLLATDSGDGRTDNPAGYYDGFSMPFSATSDSTSDTNETLQLDTPPYSISPIDGWQTPYGARYGSIPDIDQAPPNDTPLYSRRPHNGRRTPYVVGYVSSANIGQTSRTDIPQYLTSPNDVKSDSSPYIDHVQPMYTRPYTAAPNIDWRKNTRTGNILDQRPMTPRPSNRISHYVSQPRVLARTNESVKHEQEAIRRSKPSLSDDQKNQITELGCTELKDELRIVLIGKTGVGKSATANSILGKNAFKSITAGASVTRKCESSQAHRFGKKLLVVDTPGMYDTGATIEQTKDEVSRLVNMTLPGPHAIILVLAIRGRFTEEEQRTVEHFSDLFGKGMYRYMIVLFTGRDSLERDSMDIKTYIKHSPKELRVLITKCNYHYIAFDNNKCKTQQDNDVKQLLDMIKYIVECNGGSCYTNSMYQEAVNDFDRHRSEMVRKMEEEKGIKERKIRRNVEEMYRQKQLKLEQENRFLKADQTAFKQKSKKKISELKSNIEQNQRIMEETKQDLNEKLRNISSQLHRTKARASKQTDPRLVLALQEQIRILTADKEERQNEKRSLKENYETMQKSLQDRCQTLDRTNRRKEQELEEVKKKQRQLERMVANVKKMATKKLEKKIYNQRENILEEFRNTKGKEMKSQCPIM